MTEREKGGSCSQYSNLNRTLESDSLAARILGCYARTSELHTNARYVKHTPHKWNYGETESSQNAVVLCMPTILLVFLKVKLSKTSRLLGVTLTNSYV